MCRLAALTSRWAPALSVLGEVSDERGKPIVGAVVQMNGGNGQQKVVTSAGGIYQFDGCEPGNAIFRVLAKGRARKFAGSKSRTA